MILATESSARILIWQDKVFASQRAPGRRQQSTPTADEDQKPSVRLKGELIELTVFVSDRKGRPVTDLRAEDFLVMEDGRPQRVTHFSSEGFDLSLERPVSEPAAAGEPLAARRAARRTILMVVDDLHISQMNMMRIRGALLDFINFDIRDDDQLAFVTTSGSLGFLQQLTEERAAMRLAINRLSAKDAPTRMQQSELTLTPYQADLIARRDPRALEAAVAELRAKAPGLQQTPVATDIIEGRAISIANQVIQFTEQRALSTIETLAGAVRGLKTQPGVKLAIFISDGFFMSSSLNQARKRLLAVTDAAARTGLVVYTLDASGLQANLTNLEAPGHDLTPLMRMQRRATRFLQQTALQAGLRALADDTGGKSFLNSNDVKASLQNAVLANNFFYSLGYQPTQPRESKAEFRQIHLSIDGRPDLTVRFQRGYLATLPNLADNGTAPQTPRALLEKGLKSIAPLNDVGLAARANFLNLAQHGSVIITAIEVDARMLRFETVTGRHQDDIEFSGLFYDTAGKIVHSFSKNLRLNLKPETYQDLLTKGIEYIDHFATAPGLYQMRVAVLEPSSGRLGSASQWVEVPDLTSKQLQMSDIFFLENVTLNRPAKESPFPQLITEGKLVTPTKRVFPESSWIDFGFYIYNAWAGENQSSHLVAQIQILAHHLPVFASPVQSIPAQLSEDPERIFFGNRLPLTTLRPGKYFLQVTVIDPARRQQVTQRIDFTVI